jgi:hypothetical protein
VTRRNLLVGVVVLAVVTAAVVGVLWWRDSRRTELARAADLLPADTLRASWTDWAGVRAELGLHLDDASSGDQVRDLINKAFDRDLSSASSTVDSAVALHQKYGFSPATAEWELYGQSEQGAVMLLRVPDSTDFGSLEDRLTGLGYTRPSDSDGVWSGGSDLVPTIDPTLSPELQYVALLADQHLVLTSDTDAYLAGAVKSASGDADRLTGADDLVGQVDEPLAAVLFTGDFACSALAMSQADDQDRQLGQSLVEDAGGVNPFQGLLVAALPDRRFRVVMDFESDEQATANARSRATLASGEAPGKGGDFPDRFSVTSAASEGHQAILDLAGKPGQYVLSDLTTGPVLPETC